MKLPPRQSAIGRALTISMSNDTRGLGVLRGTRAPIKGGLEDLDDEAEEDDADRR